MRMKIRAMGKLTKAKAKARVLSMKMRATR